MCEQGVAKASGGGVSGGVLRRLLMEKGSGGCVSEFVGVGVRGGVCGGGAAEAGDGGVDGGVCAEDVAKVSGNGAVVMFRSLPTSVRGGV
jgi:hypothetical protein